MAHLVGNSYVNLSLVAIDFIIIIYIFGISLQSQDLINKSEIRVMMIQLDRALVWAHTFM